MQKQDVLKTPNPDDPCCHDYCGHAFKDHWKNGFMKGICRICISCKEFKR